MLVSEGLADDEGSATVERGGSRCSFSSQTARSEHFAAPEESIGPCSIEQRELHRVTTAERDLESAAARGVQLTPVHPRLHAHTTETSWASSGSGCSGDPLAAIERTFYLMENRMRQRALHGKRRAKGTARTLLDAGLVIVPFIVFSDLIDFNPRWKRGTVIPLLVSVWIVSINLWMMIQSPEDIALDWAKTTVYICVMWLAWVYDPDFHRTCYLWGPAGFQYECVTDEEWHVINALIFTEIAILLMWLLVVVVYPRVLICAGAQTFWRLRQHPDGQPGKFSYRPFGWFSLIRRTCTYHGEVDSRGRPHGQGSWTDDYYFGECMTGLWEHGVPVGPFASREHGTGAQFANLRLGFCTARAEQDIRSSALFPHTLPQPRVGVASVECSTSGGFLSFLPRVDIIKDFGGFAGTERALSWVQEGRAKDKLSSIRLKIIDDSHSPEGSQGIIARHSTREQLTPVQDSGYNSNGVLPAPYVGEVVEQCCLQASVPVHILRGRGYVLASQLPAPVTVLHQPKREALIFVHGFNASLSDGLTRMGQVCALGSLPSHIVPFLYSWASGQIPTYAQVKASTPQSARDLAPFVEALAAQGIARLHLMIHSMGAQVLLAAWPELKRVFRRLRTFDTDSCALRAVETSDSGGPVRLPVLGTLTLVNADTSRERVMQVLPELVEFAEHVTFYNDAHDIALWGSSILSREPAFGRFPETVCCNYNGKEYGIGYIDVIDCTSMEQNVHAVRHNYYCFNVQILEDLVDLIQSGAPASLRTSRLVSKGIGNVFSFLCPPAFLME